MKQLLYKKPLPVILFTVFVDMLGFGILLPVIPLLLADPFSPYYLLPKGLSVKEGYILLGFLVATFSLMQFLSAPILGQLSDKYGRKKLLAISLAGTSLSYILFAIGIVERSIPLLFIARGLDGITGGNISVAQAAIADVTAPEDRAKNFGLIGAAFGLGFILGPYIGGKLSDPTVVSWFSASTPFWFSAILSFLNVLSVLFLFPETLKFVTQHIHVTWDRSIRNIIEAFNFKDLRALFSTVFLFQGGFTFYTTFFSIFLIRKFGFSQSSIGDFFSYVGIWIAISQIIVIRRISSIFQEYEVLRVSLLALAFFTFLYFFTPNWWILLLVAPFFAVSNGLTQANLSGLVSRSVDRSIQGKILGVNASVQALAQAIPPILSGFMAAAIEPDAPIMVSAFVIAVAGLIFTLFYQPKKTLDSGVILEA